MLVKIWGSHVNSGLTRVDYLPMHVNFDFIHVKPDLTRVNGKAHSMKPFKTIKKWDTFLSFVFIYQKKCFSIKNHL